MSAHGGIVVVGAGECGARAALALRDNGFEGAVTLVGDEAAAPYERPPLSKEALTAAPEVVPKTVATPRDFERSGIALLAERRAVGIDRAARTVELADGGRLAYDRLLLATGARAARLPARLDPERQVLYLRSLTDARHLRARLRPGARLAVIGGGFIGLELAASARRLGVEVCVLELQPRVLMRAVPEPIARRIAARHAAAGVALRCGVAVEAVGTHRGGLRIALGGGETLDIDAAVAGVGAVPEIALAVASGLAVENGVKVDRRLRCGDGIFAAGDCCSFPLPLYGGRRVRLESWRNALDQAALAARNLLGAEDEVASVPWFWSDQYELTFEVAGLVDEGEVAVTRRGRDDAFLLFHLAADGCLVAASGLGRGPAVARDMRVAERLIARRARPDPAALASPATRLKSLLARE